MVQPKKEFFKATCAKFEKHHKKTSSRKSIKYIYIIYIVLLNKNSKLKMINLKEKF